MPRIAIDTPTDVRLLTKGFSVGEALGALNAANPEAGAIVSFVGKVRPEQSVQALELTHYEPLTLPGMVDLAERALERFELDGVLAWHRIGYLSPGQAIVLVAAASRHRRSAFGATDYLMDHLKSAAWFWKREKRADEWRWIEPTPRDHADRARWDCSN